MIENHHYHHHQHNHRQYHCFIIPGDLLCVGSISLVGPRRRKEGGTAAQLQLGKASACSACLGNLLTGAPASAQRPA